MNYKKINSLISFSDESKQYLKSGIIIRLKTESYRDLEKITGLNSKQLQRIIHEDKFPHFDSLIKAIQGLLDNPIDFTAKKRRE